MQPLRVPPGKSPFPTLERKPIVRQATPTDLRSIYELYQTVARVNRGALTPEEDEITLEWIGKTMEKARERGRILLLEKDRRPIAYLKAFTSEFRCLAHVLTHTTLMVHPEWQGCGYGSQLMEAYLAEIKTHMRHVLRFELLPHQSNPKAIRFYEKHGFLRESLAAQRIRKPEGQFEAEVRMVWFNPNFSEESLKQYHAFLRESQTTRSEKF